MSQFTLHRNAHAPSSKIAPFLLNVQHPLLSNLDSRVVLPIIPVATGEPSIARLDLPCEIDGIKYLIKTQSISTVPPAHLGQKMRDLSDRRHEIIAALDMLISGI